MILRALERRQSKRDKERNIFGLCVLTEIDYWLAVSISFVVVMIVHIVYVTKAV